MLLLVYLLLWLLASIALWSAVLPIGIALIIQTILLGHASYSIPKHLALTQPTSIVGLRYDDSGWQVRNKQGDWEPMVLLPGSIVLSWLIVMPIRIAQERRTKRICIAYDALEQNMHRRLRVHIQFTRHIGAALK